MGCVRNNALGSEMHEILSFCKNETTTTFGDQEVIIEEGKKSERLLILVRGKIEIVKDGATIAILSDPGSLLGEMSLLNDTPHTATCRSCGDSEFYSIADGKNFLHQNPQIFWLVSKDLANKLQLTTECLASFSRNLSSYSSFELNRQLDLAEEVLDAVTR
jgi:CRP/FNR family cyclic AMP-dependent transcriptional regulator